MNFQTKCLCFMLLVCSVILIGCGGGKRRNVTVVQYMMNTLDLPSPNGFGFRINDEGESVGVVFGYGVVKWNVNRVPTRLPDPPGCQILNPNFNSTYINSSGAVTSVALILQDNNTKNAVILWQPDGEVQIIRSTDYPDVCFLQVFGITDSGKVIFLQKSTSTGVDSIIVYNSEDQTFTDGTPSGGLEAFSAQNPNCNNFGLVVGQKEIDGKTRAVVIDTSAKTLRVLPMLPQSNTTDVSYATAVNNHGIVAGCCALNGQPRWVIWDALGNIHDLGLPPSFNGGLTTGINDEGMIIGTAGKESGSSAFIRLSDGRWINLGLFEGISASYPYGLNNQGQVVGVSDPPDEFGTRISRPVIWSPIN